MKLSQQYFSHKLTFSVITILIIAIALSPVNAQEAKLDLQIKENSILRTSAINTTAFLNRKNKSQGLFSIFIKNQNNQSAAKELYIDFKINSKKNGLLWHQYQTSGQPFSLNPSQQVYSPNINAVGLPGTGTQIVLQGGLTDAGKKMLNSMKGSTNLPKDIYTIKVCIYQGGNVQTGGTQKICDELQFGTSLVENADEIYLTTPGAVSGSNIDISTLYPNFSWSGLTGVDYRLIVVEAQPGRSPQSLINSALSSAPILIDNTPGSGRLLSFEKADVILSGSSFQYPVAGVQNLEPGQKYYWQVFALTDDKAEEMQSSEIWSFRVAENADLTTEKFNAEMLVQIIGRSKYEQLKKEGFHLVAIEINGTVYTAEELEPFLERFNIKIEQGEITLINN